MRTHRRRAFARALSAGAAALALALAGCNGAETDPDAGPDVIEYEPPPRPMSRIELDYEWEWEDIDRLDNGERDPEEVAMWVAERNRTVQRCLNQEPPALYQAIEVLKEILARVPSSSRDRGLLAQCYFADAAYWFKVADNIAWEMDRLLAERTLPNWEGGARLTDAEVEKLVSDYRAFLEKANRNLEIASRNSLRAFTRYAQARPDDKGVYDFVWKLHFYLQNYDESLRWLNLVIHEMDLAEVPDQEPLRQRYTDIRDQMVDYLADRRIEGAEAERPRGFFDDLGGGSTPRGSYGW